MSRTLKIDTPPMKGDDVDAWRVTLNKQMETWDVAFRLPVKGPYDVAVRSLTASVCHGLGLSNASEAMKDGLTPELRIKLRNKNQTPEEKKRYAERKSWRVAFAKRHEDSKVHPPLTKILQSSWGWTPPVHDGVDLICGVRAPLLAICRAKVTRADGSGWWGKGAPSPAIAAKGDGIIILQSLTDVGPFKVGLNFCYGHAEAPRVKVGQTVEAGEHIGTAGLANAWHIHFMVNDDSGARGVGDRDPMPFVNYAKENS